MRLGVLLSGGKDSCYALYKASKEHSIICLLSIESKNPYSYMFHTPNVKLVRLQAESIGLPLLIATTEGEKEKELRDLKFLIRDAKERYKIEGIVTGAIRSVYQATRIQKICNELRLLCLNPLWQCNEIKLLNALLRDKFAVIITSVSAYPLDESFLGKKIDREIIKKLEYYKAKYKINPSGEGGELETFVINAPMFKKRILIKKSEKKYSNNSGIFIIKEAELK